MTALPSAITPLHQRGARIEVKKLGKAYRHGGKALPVLWDVDLSLAPGDMVAVVGASGVGKSTFLQILGTLDLPTSGSIRFDGEELTTMNSSRLAEFRNNKIGFVFQFHHLLPEFTAVENVMMPALIQGIPVEKAKVRAKDILGRVGLSHRLTHRPGELSGGEQQRVALARAMVLEPALLLADEPTGNLDRATGEAIHQLLKELNRERGSTLLVVTHNPELASLMPRKLRMVDGGRLVEEAAGRSSPSIPVAELDPTSEAEVVTTPSSNEKPMSASEAAMIASSLLGKTEKPEAKVEAKPEAKVEAKPEAKVEAKPDEPAASSETDKPKAGGEGAA